MSEDVRVTAVAAMARARHGLVRRDDLRAIGMTDREIDGWIGVGRLERLHQRVYRLAGAPASPEQRLLAAVMAGGPDAVASHRSAGWLWRLVDDLDVVEVTVPRDGRRIRLDGIVAHRSSDLTELDGSTRRGVPVTNPLRTLVDLGAVCPRWVVREALERALTARLVTVLGADAAVDRVARKGRNGVGVLRRVLDDRALGNKPAASELEARMARLFRTHALPTAAFQHVVCDADRFVARVDWAYPELKIAVEVDGWASHGTPIALQRDLARQNDLVLLGWTVLRFTWHDVVRRPPWVAGQIRRVLGSSPHLIGG